MPTPVSAARQCLAGEAAAALDEAVAVARRRAHGQTTSLHVVSALLSLHSTSPPSSSPSTLLRDALYRARSAAYAPARLQLKALELSFSGALDRLPSAVPGRKLGAGDGNAQRKPPAEPPVSNSLMAAIKRSQANQRRNPDTFHLYQQQQQLENNNNYSSAGVKVELRQLVLSILDDPVVSRVFGEAGFRSCDIKFAVLRPPSSLLRFPRAAARCPPLFLCNFSVAADELDVAPRGCPLPFSNHPLYCDGADENCGRIAQVLVKGRNPLLVGVGASEAARDFERALVAQKWAAFPPELRGAGFFSIEKVISEFVRDGRRSRPWLGTGFGEVGLWLAAAARERRPSPGIVLGLGELEALVDMVWEAKEGSDGLGGASYVVAELSKLVEGHPGRLWLMGSVATYETYMKFLAHYPYLDKDWNLQLLPVTSLKPGSAELCSRASSLTESLVPFGGLFPVANNSVAPSITQSQSEVPCHLCSDMYDQEIAALLNEFCVSVDERWHDNLPQLLQSDPNRINGPQDVEKANGDGTILNAKVINSKKKWSDICQRLHQGNRILERDTLVELNAFPDVVSLAHVTIKESSCNEYLPSKPQSWHSNSAPFQTNSSTSHSGSLSDASAPEVHKSSSPMVSVSTDLVLGIVHHSSNKDTKCIMHDEHLCESPACQVSKEVDVIKGNASATPQYSSCLAYSDSPMLTTCFPAKAAFGSKAGTDKRKFCSSNACEPFNIRDLKTFCSSLAEKVSWQEEAAQSIGQTLARCRTGNERTRGVSLRGDIWLGFLGPDRVGKRRTAMALAELLLGDREKLVVVDLCLQHGLVPSNAVCSNLQDADGGLSLRGKTVVDHIADEISKKPCSVVLLENVDKADLLVQGSLSQAIRTGKFSDSYRRDVSINNAVFVLTAGVKGKTVFLNRHSMFSEEQILAARPQKMMIIVDYASESIGGILSPDEPGRESKSRHVYVGKRKLNMADSGNERYGVARLAKQAKGTANTLLDLNLPVEEVVTNHRDYSGDESSSITENTEASWLEEFLDALDETVFFKPFDFDALADDVLKEISGSFQSAMRSNGVLEIDPNVMEQILAAVWLSEDRAALSNWVQQVLVRSFMEAQQIYKLSAQMVLRLVAGEDHVFMEDLAPGILLPSHVLLG